jgi:hypothetical protein
VNSNNLPSIDNSQLLGHYEIEPGDEVDYAIDYDKQTSNFMNASKKKKQGENMFST